MELHKLGENRLVRCLKSRFNQDLPSSVLVGIGDDCAVLRRSDAEVQLVTCDMLIENVHFRREYTSPESLGHKSLAVNLSDIAGMGGVPEAAFLSLAISQDVDLDWVDKFFDGVQELAEESQVHLLGGDLSFSSALMVNFTLIGKGKPEHVRYRSRATHGDVICTTGYLGDAGAGLRLIEDHSIARELPSDLYNALTKSWLRPTPHLRSGRWLAEQPAVHAMMDVSDGIASDLPRLVGASGLGSVVHLERLPISPKLRAVANTLEWSTHEFATSSGEDYCLLLTVDKKAFATLQSEYKAFCGGPLFEIGHVTKDPRSITYLDQGVETILASGFDHFHQRRSE